MAVVTISGTNVANLDAAPPVVNDVTIMGARVRSQVETVEVANGDSIGSTYRLGRIPSNATVLSIRLYCDAITSAAADIGLYQTAANGGAVVDADVYGSAVSLASASTTGIEVAFEARNVDKVRNKLWQDAGLAADPIRHYDLVATLTAAATATGTLSAVIQYAVD
jgi:hypothetical protein